MKLIIFVLNQEERLEEILEAFLELGINGATILDTIGMGRILAHDIPIFAGFQNLLHDTRPGNKTIISVVPEKKVERIIQAIEQIIGSLDEPGNGIFISLPVDFVKGYKEL
jgi:nitrogen regulatory protein P-II 1